MFSFSKGIIKNTKLKTRACHALSKHFGQDKLQQTQNNARNQNNGIYQYTIAYIYQERHELLDEYYNMRLGSNCWTHYLYLKDMWVDIIV